MIQCKEEIVPIEVKAEQHLKSRSLSEYRKKYEPKHAVKTSMLGDAAGEDVLKIPLYMICTMPTWIK